MTFGKISAVIRRIFLTLLHELGKTNAKFL
jgi:hypothetical protein